MKALLLFWSQTGNTEKVADTLEEELNAAEIAVTRARIAPSLEVDLFDYDLICLGFPAYSWSPPKPVDAFLRRTFNTYRQKGYVRLKAPPRPGKYALIFCTYSGPHTGIREAIPAGKYAGQFFEHLGIPVADEWYIVGEFHGREDASTQGRLGDIRGRPNEEDLARIRRDIREIIEELR
mgnify:CR=1 FL=1